MSPGRLSAVLCFWLLALECRASSLSRISASAKAFARLHRHNLEAAARATKPNLTQAQEFVKADTDAEDDFVRRCEVVVTVSDRKFLPVKPLDKFCRTTDAVVECRTKVGQRLKETHARDGDMGKFCSAVYDWFQGKYGMKCPKQCRKLQCKSTCMWLDAKKKLNKDDTQIKDDMMAAELALKGIKAMGEKVHEMLASEKKQKFAIKMLNVKKDRAQKSLDEKKKDHTDAKGKMAKVNTAYKKLQSTIEKTAGTLIDMDDDIMKRKFAIDKAKLKLEGIERSISRGSDKAKADRAEQKSLQAQSSKLNATLTELNTKKGSLQKTVDETQKAANATTATMKKKIAAMLKAAKELEAFKVGKLLLQDDSSADPVKWEQVYAQYMTGNYKKDPSVPIIKELVANQHKRVKAVEAQLDKLNKKLRDANDEIKELDADIGRATAQKKTADDAAAAAGKKAGEREGEAKKEGGEAAILKSNSITKPEAELKKAQEKQTKTQASKAKAERTLKHMGELVREQQAKLDAANGAMSTADLALKALLEQITKSGETLAGFQKQITDAQKKEKDAKGKLAKEEVALTGRIKTYKAANLDLEKHKPEIVRQHGLQPEL